MEFTEIKTVEEYNQALERLEELFEAKGSKEKQEFLLLSDLIDDYEDSLLGDDEE